MSRTFRLSTLILGGALLSACGASPATQANLMNAQSSCGNGNLQACNDIPYVQHAAQEEAKANTALFLLPFAILLVLAGQH
jgi:hypothetical protein